MSLNYAKFETLFSQNLFNHPLWLYTWNFIQNKLALLIYKNYINIAQIFWFQKILLKSIEKAKPKFQPRYAYKLYVYKNRACEMWKKVIDYCKKYFWDVFAEFIFKMSPNCKNNFRKALFQFAKINSTKLSEN